MSDRAPIAVIGAGSWGTALALLLAKNGERVMLWGHSDNHVQEMERDRENRRYLPGFPLPGGISPTATIKTAVEAADIVCMVVPSHGFRAVFEAVAPLLRADALVVSATKGIENKTLMTMSQVMQEVLQRHGREENITLAVLSGPSFAREVAAEVPTAITIGSRDKDSATRLQYLFNSPYFRVYTSTDTIGLEISAALKNIVAIAAGICDGLNFGTNARAALITRGLVEITRLGIKLGAEQKTFYGLSGLGDLVLTCTGDLSRNRTVGIKLGEGHKLKAILAEMSMVAEGVKTTKSVYELAGQLGIEMPILEQVYQILYEDKDCRTAVRDLLNRDLKTEES